MNKPFIFFVTAFFTVVPSRADDQQKLLENSLTKAAFQATISLQKEWWNTSVLPEKKIVVVITSYNNRNWYAYNLGSLFAQQYHNYRVIYVDDCSTDDTAQLVDTYVQEHHQEHRTSLIKNSMRQFAMKNLYEAITSCEDDEIVAILDGDDMFAHPYVLSYLNKLYSENDIWLTFGNLLLLSTGQGCWWSMPIPPEIVQWNQFREWPHIPTHLRTFYAWLFKKVKVEDLQYKGEFLLMTSDVAMILPMIEMAGERHKFIYEILYAYNDLNSINDHKINQQLQLFLNRYIRSKPKYQRLDASPITKKSSAP